MGAAPARSPALTVRERRTRLGRAWRTAALVGLAACAGTASGPPTVHWGTDECSHCHMIVSEERFAAVARSTSGEEARFDDLGCLRRWLAGRDVSEWQLWAHDAGGAGWLAATEAWYTQAPGVSTPMGSGLRAWASREAADAAGGTVRSWREMLAIP